MDARSGTQSMDGGLTWDRNGIDLHKCPGICGVATAIRPDCGDSIGLFVLMFGVVFLPAVYVPRGRSSRCLPRSILGFISGPTGVLAG